jgi:hypothetical protein
MMGTGPIQHTCLPQGLRGKTAKPKNKAVLLGEKELKISEANKAGRVGILGCDRLQISPTSVVEYRYEQHKLMQVGSF